MSRRLAIKGSLTTFHQLSATKRGRMLELYLRNAQMVISGHLPCVMNHAMTVITSRRGFVSRNAGKGIKTIPCHATKVSYLQIGTLREATSRRV